MKIITGSTPTTNNLAERFSRKSKFVAKFINLKEDSSKLSTMRLGQEFATNWFPKAIFARSFADLSEVSFLEFSENILVYVIPVVLANACKNLYSKVLPQGLKSKVATQAKDLMVNKTLENKKLMNVKAAIAISAFAVPLAEYSISYVKNLFTLKLFKQADFNNIANLNKNKTEDVEKQKQVKDSAKKHIKLASGLFAGCLALSALLLTKGKKPEVLNHLSEAVLAPGSKFFKKGSKTEAIINKYFGLDFFNEKGKIVMPNGMITACVTVGGFGYFGAAKDRGKQNFKEVLYRFPLVGLYAITGSELIETGFKKYLQKKESYKDLFGKNLEVPKLSELGELAEKLAIKKGTKTEAEFNRLFRQKSTIVMAPFLFGLGFMGFFVAGISRFFTQYRYNKENHNKNFDAFQKADISSFGMKK